MKDEVELVGVVVKINGKKKVIAVDKCMFHGWEVADDCMTDNGVDLFINIGKKHYKILVN